MQHDKELVKVFSTIVEKKPEILLASGQLNEIITKVGRGTPLTVEETLEALKLMSSDGERVERVFRSLADNGGVDSDPFYLTLASWLVFRPRSAWVVLSLLANHAGLKVKMPSDQDFGTVMSRILTPENGFEKSVFTPTGATRQLPTHVREKKNDRGDVPQDWWLNHKWLKENGYYGSEKHVVMGYNVIISIASLDEYVESDLFITKLLNKLLPDRPAPGWPLEFARPYTSEEFPFEQYDPALHQTAKTRITLVEAIDPQQPQYDPVTLVVSPQYENM